MGPFRLMDLIGNDVNYAVSCSVYEQLGSPERLRPSLLQKERVDKQELGRKTKKGIMDMSKPTKILITGGTGFLGAYIIQELIEQGYAVRALRRSHKLPFYIAAGVLDQVEWVDGDILGRCIAGGSHGGVIDAVIHSACQSFL